MASSRLITTSNFLSEEKIENAIQNSKNLGFKEIKVKKDKRAHFSRWAGTAQERLQELEEAFGENTHCIQACIGGSGIIHFLNNISFKELQNKPKFLVGSSDLTPLLNYSFQETKIISLHGPNASKEIDEESQKSLRNALEGTNYELAFSSFENPSQEKRIVGKIQGGNLAMCSWSLSSKFEVNLKNRIVFFEDIGTTDATAYNRIVQLKESGTLKPKAILFGYLMEVKNVKRFIKSIQELFPEIPIIYNLPIGHKLPNITVPIGSKTVINFSKKKITFKIEHACKSYRVNFNE